MAADSSIPRTAPSCITPPAVSVQWFQDEVHAHDDQLKSYLKSSFPAVPDLEDVVQESYLRVWKAKAVQPIRSAKSYLFTVAKNLALGWIRHRNGSPVEGVGDLEALRILDDEPDAAALLSTKEKVELAAAALMVLPDRCRQTVMLRKLKGLTQKETAEALGISVKTVDKHLATGLERLAVYLRSRGIEDLFDK